MTYPENISFRCLSGGCVVAQTSKKDHVRMFNEIPLSMALLDILPNLFFLLGAWWLYRASFRSPLFALGAALVFLNGMSKAAWKLIIALGGPDIAWLSQIFVFLLSAGFVLMLAAVVRANRQTRPAPAQAAPLLAVPPLMAAWKIPFMVVTFFASVSLYGLWIAAAWRGRNLPAAAGFALTLAATLAMSGLSGSEMDSLRHWIAEWVNTAGQASFAAAAYFFTHPPVNRA
jgi:hypothetical protein